MCGRLMGLAVAVLLLGAPIAADAAVTVLDTVQVHHSSGTAAAVPTGIYNTPGFCTVTSGATLLLVSVSTVMSATSVGSETLVWDSAGANQSMTLVRADQPGGSMKTRVEIWKLASPTAGSTKALDFTGGVGYSNIAYLTFTCLTVTGGTTTANDAGTGGDTVSPGDAISLDITSATGALTFTYSENNTGHAYTHTGSTTSIYAAAPHFAYAGSQGSSETTDTHSWTLAGASNWTMSGVAVLATASGAPNFQPAYPSPLSPLGGPR